jgi:hypothetical protein
MKGHVPSVIVQRTVKVPCIQLYHQSDMETNFLMLYERIERRWRFVDKPLEQFLTDRPS